MKSLPKKSAGLILYRFKNNLPEIFLVHPGGPFWSKKDLGVWSIPKGEFEESENPLHAAMRETEEETGIDVRGTLQDASSDSQFIELKPVKLKSGKTIYAWALEWNFEPVEFKSNLFEMEWPPKSGKRASFPEVDKTGWFGMDDAKKKITAGQIPLIDELGHLLKNPPK